MGVFGVGKGRVRGGGKGDLAMVKMQGKGSGSQHEDYFVLATCFFFPLL